MSPHRTRFHSYTVSVALCCRVMSIMHQFDVLLLLCMYLIIFAKVDINGVFKSAFVVHCAAVDVINAHGRPVCSTDFGHFKHDYFDGLNATGLCFYLLHSLCVMQYLCCVLGRIVPDGQWEVVGGLDCYIC